jgi:hypothetical protein
MDADRLECTAVVRAAVDTARRHHVVVDRDAVLLECTARVRVAVDKDTGHRHRGVVNEAVVMDLEDEVIDRHMFRPRLA